MDRHLPDDQLDRMLLGFLAERRDELLASAPTAPRNGVPLYIWPKVKS